MLRPILKYPLALLLCCGNVATVIAGSHDLDRETLSPVKAFPAQNIKIDGDLSEWSFANSQVIYVSEEMFDDERGEFAFSYDKDNLYFAIKVKDASPLKNIHHVSGRFWEGDSIQLRLYAKPNASSVPQRRRDVNSQDKQVAHVNIYFQHPANKNWARIDYSIDFIESVINPDGADVAFKELPDKSGYQAEMKLPWKILNTAIKPGDSIRGLVELNFSDFSGQKRVRRTSGAYNKNPGDFGFLGGDNWGVIQLAESASEQRDFPDAKTIAASRTAPEGLEIALEYPFDSCATINIYDQTGKLVRELVQDKIQPKGKHSAVWNGKDNTGKDVPPGQYSYRSCFYPKIEADYKGSVASSGNPPYATDDGCGEWGGDHSYPLAVSADAKGYTFLWPIAELGKAIVRTDKNDKILWRYTPFFDSAGNFYTMASDGDYVYLTYETRSETPQIFRLNVSDGVPDFFVKDTKGVKLPVGDVKRRETLPNTRATAFDLIASGMAVDRKYIYVAINPGDEILVLDKKNASLVRKIKIPSPRGLACDDKGSLYAVSFPAPEKGAIYKIEAENGISKLVDGLDAPWNIAVKSNGNILVSDLGKSQQVKEFNPAGKFVRGYGSEGGRPTSGKYQAGNFLTPSGIAVGPDDRVMVVESSIPSVISRLDNRGNLIRQWFGPGNYAHAVWPDALDPMLIYSMVPGGILRSKLNGSDKSWKPDAYWSFTTTRERDADKLRTYNLSFDYFKDQYFRNFTGLIAYPQTSVFHGYQYMSSDSAEHPIVRVEDDKLYPVATCFAAGGKVHIAHDVNGNGVIDKDEIETATNIPAIADKRPETLLNGHTGSHTFSEYSGNWYIAGENKVYKIPLKSCEKGMLVFDVDKAKIFINDISNGDKKRLFSSWRSGILGMREDSSGNLYVLYTYGGKSQGIGHSSDITDVFLAKFDSAGTRVWTSGRKAASFARPGEIYNPWVMAGILNDRLIAIADENGGMIHFYDTDGFYRGRIFDDYAMGDAQPGPYLFHGENFSGRVQYFPKLKKYMAYQGMTDSRAFELKNIEAPIIRNSGNIELLKNYSGKTTIIEETGINIVSSENIDIDAAKWKPLPAFRIADAGALKLALTSERLYFEFEVKDKTPLMNSESDSAMAFKGGDAVDLYLGKNDIRKDDKPVSGDVRILISPYRGTVRITGMKVVSETVQRKLVYMNPAGYKRSFDYVGEIPDSKAVAEKSANGYFVRGYIPLSFLSPLVFKRGERLKFDADILQSDASGQRTVSRIFRYASGNSALTMTQDIPTECYLYPTYWGQAVIK